MRKLKDACGYLLAFVTFILPRFALSVALGVLMIFPLSILGFPFWIDSIIIFVMVLSIPFISGLTECVIWAWAFIVVLSKPISGWSIFYFVAFAIYFFSTLLPIVINIVTFIFNSITEVFDEE